MSYCTLMVCRECGKELKRGEKEAAEKRGVAQCAQCEDFEALGVKSIEQYNAWLRGDPIPPYRGSTY